MKFDIGGDQGLDVFAEGFPRSVAIACPAAAAKDVVEETLAGNESSLNYRVDEGRLVGEYTYLWKTDSAWAGSCRQLQIRLNDAHQYNAYFQFTR